ncbi:MAG: ABC transporter permease [Acidimicrobiales bacterium]
MSTILPETPVVVVGSAEAPARQRQLRRGFKAHPGSIVAGLVLAIFLAVAIFAPLIEPYSPSAFVGAVFGHPSPDHWLGLSGGGMDVLSQLIQGSRVSLLVGVAAMSISMVLGTGIGVLSGYFGGATDVVAMRITDYFLVIPYLPLMLIVAAIWGPSLIHTILVIGFLQWGWTARIIRSQVKSLRARAYVQRTLSLGATHARVVFRHILPQLGPLLVSLAVLHVAYAIFAQAALDFLGVGDPTTVSWGTMIEQAFQRTAISTGAWWAIVPPGVCIAVVIVCCYLVGQAIEDALDPGLRRVNLSPNSFRVRAAAGELGG